MSEEYEIELEEEPKYTVELKGQIIVFSASDDDAIHDNVNNEIHLITEKSSPVDADEIIIEDSEASYAKKRVQMQNLPGGADSDAYHDNVANEITATAEKTSTVANDEYVMEDSAASFVKKSIKFSNIEGSIDHVNIGSIGSNTHAQIDTHLGLTDEHLNWKNSVGTIHTDNYIEGGDGTDTTAIHDDTANEITAITQKTTPAANDEFIMEDSGAAYVKKAITYGNLESAIQNHAPQSHDFDTHSGDVDLTDLAPGTQGSIIRRGASDWEEYSKGTENYFLKAGASDVEWAQLTESHISDLDHDDTDAIHDNVANEITAITEKTTGEANDEFIIEDSGAANVKKSIKMSGLRITESQITNLDHDDTDAIHDNVSGEISAITEKVSPVGADMLLIEDSEATNAKKMVQITNLPGGADADAIHDNVDNEIHQITEKVSPAGADELIIEDSAASYAKKRVQITNLPAGSPSFGIPTGDIDIGDTASEGSSGDATRADHQHAFSAPGAGYPQDVGDTESDGTATTPARSDHVHAHGSRTNSNAHRWNDIAAMPDTSTTTIGKSTPTSVTLHVGHNGTSGLVNTFNIYDHEHSSTAGTGGVINHSDINDDESAQHVDWAAASAGTIHTDNYIEGGAGTDTTAIHDDTSDEINQITAKGTPVGADKIVIEDSAASWAKKSVTITNLNDMLDHDVLENISSDDHHAQAHNSSHETGGADEIYFSQLEQSSGDATLHNSYTTTPHVSSGEKTGWDAKMDDLVDDTSPQLGGDLDLNEKCILIDPSLTTNLEYEGTVLELTVSGLTVGQCVYVSGNNAGALADADAVGTMPAVGIYVGTNLVLTHGIIRQDTWTWTAGQRLYVGTDGELTSTAPSGTGDYVQIMGIAVNADAALIMPSLTEVKHL